ncbi:MULTISPECIES: hypothetical protein [Roseicyclus]|uniref:hypothetical protein n=1 Tax=Roseicyclus amphidinii TaxID=3034232 RepID=UPI0024E121F6|nr:hypothetical protein [Roseicyclus sp. Amp-Y-6]
MWSLLRVLVLVVALAGPASACPDPIAVPAAHAAWTGRDLWSPEVVHLRAGGEVALWHCGFGRQGVVRPAPDLQALLTGMGRYARLHLRANAECDTVLLLRDPRGRWFFDDDSGTGRTASLSLDAPADGSYRVWVGTYRPGGCAARLTLETF